MITFDGDDLVVEARSSQGEQISLKYSAGGDWFARMRLDTSGQVIPFRPEDLISSSLKRNINVARSSWKGKMYVVVDYKDIESITASVLGLKAATVRKQIS